MKKISLLMHSRRGFTLIEIMVVVVIIGILATIGVPAYSKMRDTARKQAVKQNLRAIVTAAQAYFADHISDANPPDSVKYSILTQEGYIAELKPAGGESYKEVMIEQNPSTTTTLTVPVPQLSGKGTDKNVTYDYR